MSVEVSEQLGADDVGPVMVPGSSGLHELPVRMSVLAVTALIVGLLACLTCFAGYVFGVVGNILAISALVFIRRAEGRLRGKTLAIAAVVLNSLAFLFGVVFTAGAAQMAKTVARYVTPVQAIQRHDGENAKAAFTPPVAAELTAERLATFDTRVKEQLGAFTGVPTKDLIEFVKRAMDGVEKQSAAMSSLPAETQDGVFAVPTDFEKGRALLIVYLDSKDKTPEFALGRIRNLGVLKDGTTEIIWLVPLKDKTPGGQSNLGNRQKQRAMERAESAVSAPADIADPQTPELEPKKSVPPS